MHQWGSISSPSLKMGSSEEMNRKSINNYIPHCLFRNAAVVVDLMILNRSKHQCHAFNACHIMWLFITVYVRHYVLHNAMFMATKLFKFLSVKSMIKPDLTVLYPSSCMPLYLGNDYSLLRLFSLCIAITMVGQIKAHQPFADIEVYPDSGFLCMLSSSHIFIILDAGLLCLRMNTLLPLCFLNSGCRICVDGDA